MLFKMPIHVLVCNVGHKTYVLLSRFPLLFEVNGQNHIHFRLMQILKNSMAFLKNSMAFHTLHVLGSIKAFAHGLFTSIVGNLMQICHSLVTGSSI